MENFQISIQNYFSKNITYRPIHISKQFKCTSDLYRSDNAPLLLYYYDFLLLLPFSTFRV